MPAPPTALPSAPLVIPSGRIHELDSLRGLAALGVVVYHFDVFLHARPWAGLLQPLYHFGWTLVDFFFVLSGFVLARTYWTPGRRTLLAHNVWDRVARLYPLHFFTLMLVLLGQGVLVRFLGGEPFSFMINDAPHFVLNLFLLNARGGIGDTSFNGPAWSISTEFMVNLLFFLIILLPRRPALLICLACWGLTAYLPERGDPLDPAMVRTFVGFFVGVLAYQVFAFGLARRIWRSSHWADVAAVALVGIVLALSIDPARHGAGLVQRLGGWPTLFALLIVVTPLSVLWKQVLRLHPLVYLGEISYSIYLVHFPLMLAGEVFLRATGLPHPYAHPASLVVFLLLTVACASLTYRYIEIPGKSWLRSFFPADRPALKSA